jgi:hypothetical protein
MDSSENSNTSGNAHPLGFSTSSRPSWLTSVVRNQKQIERFNPQSLTYSVGTHADDSSLRAENKCTKLKRTTGFTTIFRCKTTRCTHSIVREQLSIVKYSVSGFRQRFKKAAVK